MAAGRIVKMKHIESGRSTLLQDNSTNDIITIGREMLGNAGFDDSYVDYFAEGTVDILDDYAELIGEGTEVEYSYRKRLTRIVLRMLIQGESYDIFTCGSNANKRQAEKLNDLNLNTEIPSVSYKYVLDKNLVSVSVPLSEKKTSLLKDPTFIAIILGIVLGFLCFHLPDDIRSFIVDDLASPVQSTLLGVVSGIMGPYIFISMTTSIISMDSISQLTDLGWKIVKRFIGAIVFILAVSVGASALFFNSFGSSSISISPDELIDMVLDIIPTNIFTPFTENNTAQLVVLGILLGSALLLLGDKVSGLNDILSQVDAWIMSAQSIILKLVPAIPFFSLFKLMANGNFSTILRGWKWIAVVYIAYTVAVVVKAIKMSLKTGTGIADFWSKIKPVVMTAFSTSSNAAAMQQMYQVSDQELGIDPEFSSFWIPLCSSMLGIKTTLYLVTATLMTAEMSGMALTNSFMIVLVLVTLELSLASPGCASAWAIVFSIFGMSADYVGLFSTYRVLTDNYCVGVTEAYSMLEQYEAAHKLGGMKE